MDVQSKDKEKYSQGWDDIRSNAGNLAQYEKDFQSHYLKQGQQSGPKVNEKGEYVPPHLWHTVSGVCQVPREGQDHGCSSAAQNHPKSGTGLKAQRVAPIPQKNKRIQEIAPYKEEDSEWGGARLSATSEEPRQRRNWSSKWSNPSDKTATPAPNKSHDHVEPRHISAWGPPKPTAVLASKLPCRPQKPSPQGMPSHTVQPPAMTSRHNAQQPDIRSTTYPSASGSDKTDESRQQQPRKRLTAAALSAIDADNESWILSPGDGKEGQDIPSFFDQELATPTSSPTVSNKISPTGLGQEPDESAANSAGVPVVFQGGNSLSTNRFIGTWLSKIEGSPRARWIETKMPEDWMFDVDTDTGDPIAVPDAPPTFIDHLQQDVSLTWRQLNWTAAMMMRREEQMARTRAQRHGHKILVNRHLEPPQKPKLAVTKPKPLHPNAPRVPCYFRPVIMADADDIQDIYDWDVEMSNQPFDMETPKKEDIIQLIKTTLSEKLPFIVAVDGSYSGPRASESGIRRYIEFQKAQNNSRIVAFGCFTVCDTGLTGSLRSTGDRTVKLHIYVKNDYRSKKIGKILMNRMMASVSPKVKVLQGHDWICDPDNEIYKGVPGSDKAARRYNILLVDFLLERADPDFPWIQKWLTEAGWVKHATLHHSHHVKDMIERTLDKITFKYEAREELGAARKW